MFTCKQSSFKQFVWLNLFTLVSSTQVCSLLVIVSMLSAYNIIASVCMSSCILYVHRNSWQVPRRDFMLFLWLQVLVESAVNGFYSGWVCCCLLLRIIIHCVPIEVSPKLQEAQLSPRDRAMRRVNWNLANCHATVQKLLIRQVLTKSMVWSWRFSRRQCVIDNVHSTLTRSSRLPLSQV